MKTFLVIAGSIILVLVLSLGFAYLAYCVVLKAGAPRYVAVMFAIFIWCCTGWFANRNSN